MERPVPAGVYVGLVATGLFAAGAGVTGVLAMQKKSDYDDANDGTDPANAQDLQDSGKRLNLIADVLLGGAVVAGAVTAILFLNRPEVPAEKEAGQRPSGRRAATTGVRMELVPALGQKSGGVVLSGAF
jgi:hypothetical protein